MATTNPLTTTGDRLGFTLFVAVAVHTVFILGVKFSLPEATNNPHTLEITLSQHKSEKADDDADYLAQDNQQGSGTLDEKAQVTTTEQADFSDTEINKVSPQEMLLSSLNQPELDAAQITTSSSSKTKVLNKTQENPAEAEKPANNESFLERTLEMASLMAKLDTQQQEYAKRPRVRRLTAASTKAATDAFYLDAWRSKVEMVGNLNYPDQARKQKIYGDLRMAVILLPDGTIKNIEVLNSSGHQVLDAAAIRIVRLASPYAPFPEEIRKEVDQLEIIRTWQFRSNDSLASF